MARVLQRRQFGAATALPPLRCSRAFALHLQKEEEERLAKEAEEKKKAEDEAKKAAGALAHVCLSTLSNRVLVVADKAAAEAKERQEGDLKAAEEAARLQAQVNCGAHTVLAAHTRLAPGVEQMMAEQQQRAEAARQIAMQAEL